MWTRVLVLTLSLSAASFAADAKVKPPPKEFTGPDAKAQAFRAIVEQPARPNYIGRDEFDRRMYLPHDYYLGCPEAIDFLTRTPLAVDDELLKLARSDHQLIVRFRAVRILADRGNAAVGPLLLDMGVHKDPNERYVAWDLYWRALDNQKLKPPRDPRPALRQYQNETDREVREPLEFFLGHARIRAAVPLLMAQVEKSQSTSAVWALGEIRDAAAAPLLIDSFKNEKHNQHSYLYALGKIATPEAVDLLIAHLHVYGAVEGLMETKSPRAVPALRRHVARLRVLQDWEYPTARVHLLCLTEEDPRDALLVVAADAAQDQRARFQALRALRKFDTRLFTDHFLQVYRTDADEDIRRSCIWLLDGRPGTDITAAMMDHALKHQVKSMNDIATEYYLREALNRRLGTYYYEMDDLREYIRTHRSR